jgi:hypothetical protein
LKGFIGPNFYISVQVLGFCLIVKVFFYLSTTSGGPGMERGVEGGYGDYVSDEG